MPRLHTIDPRQLAIKKSLLRQRGLLHDLVEANDAAIALWNALDDERLEVQRRGIAEARASLHGGGYASKAEEDEARGLDRADAR